MRGKLPGSPNQVDEANSGSILPGAGTDSGHASAHGADLSDQEFIYAKTYVCPLCEKTFSTPTVYAGKAASAGMDIDLKSRFTNIDPLKYRPVQCPHCSYAAMDTDFNNLLKREVAKLKEQVNTPVSFPMAEDEPRSYEDAFSLYRVSLRCALIRGGKKSIQASISLYTAWLLREWRTRRHPEEEKENNEIKNNSNSFYERPWCKENELKYLDYATNYFLMARETENFPIRNMNESTFDYLLAALLYQTGREMEALKFLGGVLRNKSSNRGIQIKAEDLRDLIKNR